MDRRGREVKDATEKDYRADMGASMTDAEYQGAQGLLGRLDQAASDYGRNADKKIGEGAAEFNKTIAGMEGPTKPNETRITVFGEYWDQAERNGVKGTDTGRTEQDVTGDHDFKIYSYEEGAVGLPAKQAEAVLKEYSKYKNFYNIKQQEDGSYHITIRPTGGQVANLASDTARDLKKVEGDYHKAFNNSQDLFEEQKASAKRKAAGQIDTFNQVKNKNVQSILKQKDTFKANQKQQYEKRKAVNSQTIQALLDKGIFKKKVKVSKNG